MHPVCPPGYQMPPGYPCGSAPPPTMMYPSAPAPSLMPPGYQGYASGSSTPARSPARSRKAQMGMDNASAWLGQQHAHAPGTPGPGSAYGSRAPSVMSHAAFSTMTGGPQDDAVSVMSGTSLLELQPATSQQQAENIDPSRASTAQHDAANLAMRLTQPGDQSLQAAAGLFELLKRSDLKCFQAEIMDLLITKTLESLYGHAGILFAPMPAAQNEQGRISDMLCKLFSILYMIAGISIETRGAMYAVCQRNNIFDGVVNITFRAMGFRAAFGRSIAFLNLLARDVHCEYSSKIMAVVAQNKEIFSHVFTQMINTHVPTSIEFVVRMLQNGDRRRFREKISEVKVRMLLSGSATHEGLLKRCQRKKESAQIHNTLKIIELLVRNDAARPSPQEDAIHKWFIDANIFVYLADFLMTSNVKLIDTSLHIIADLAGSPHISPDVGRDLATLMVQPFCLQRNEMKLQNAIIHTIDILSAKHLAIQQMLSDTQALNYACHLITNYARKDHIEESTKNGLLEMALDFCTRYLALELPAELAQQLWTEGGEKSPHTSLFFNQSFVSCLLNIIVSGSTSETLKLRAVQTIAAGLAHFLAAARFATIVFNAVDEIRSESITDALVKACNNLMLEITTAGVPKHSNLFLLGAIDLLIKVVEEPNQASRLHDYAKQPSTHFPTNVLFWPLIEKEDKMVKNLLLICKRLVADDPEIQQAWAHLRDHFNALTISGNYEISPIATDIIGALGTESDNEFAMSIANSLNL